MDDLRAELKRVISAALVADKASWHPDDATALAILIVVERCARVAEQAGADARVLEAIRALARRG